MPTFVESRDANAAFNPSYVPVMVVTGATGGVGQAMLETLARHLNGRIHIVLVGRNRAAAETIIAGLPTSPESKYEFIQKETEEGIDDLLAIRYYNRFALTRDLLPLLRNAAAGQEAASVLSVLGAGAGVTPELDLQDLGMKKTYGVMRAATHTVPYNDLMIAEFARREPDIAFTHVWPGVVLNGTMLGPGKLRSFLMFIFSPLLWAIATPPEQNAEYMLFALLAAEKGMHRRGRFGEDIGMKKIPQAKDAQKILYEHSVEETASK